MKVQSFIVGELLFNARSNILIHQDISGFYLERSPQIGEKNEQKYAFDEIAFFHHLCVSSLNREMVGLIIITELLKD